MDSWRIEALTRSTAPVTSARQSLPALSHEPPNVLLRIERDALDCPDSSLSPRERGIVLLMSQGLTNKQIARQLGIAPETVKSHSKRIFLKLTVCSRAQAVYRAAALGLIALQ
jgi:LuxR family maltose regulon positive regulatory protein